jgi:soluble lytic murein transglycosylase
MNKMNRVWQIACGVALLGSVGIAIFMTLEWRRQSRYDDLIVRIARAHAIDAALVKAVIRQESHFRADARGAAGEFGLMQVMEGTGRDWAEARGISPFTGEMLLHPETNVEAGTWYLARAIAHWSDRSDPLPYALAQYNAGRTHALRWADDDGGEPEQFLANITYPGTRAYIARVLRFYKSYTAK